MISSLFYGACFMIILLHEDLRVKCMAGICLAYLVIENLMVYYVSTFILNFDITLYFTAVWALDSILLFSVACVVRGLRQKVTIALGLPLLFVQVFAIQYPDILPEYLYTFAVQSAHLYFIEVFIFSFAHKDNTVTQWLRTGTILALVFVVHLL